MKVKSVAALLAGLWVIGCSSSQAEPEAKATMNLNSTSFFPGSRIPDKYSAYGQNVSPELSWSDVPQGTQSLVLLVEDPDAPKSQPFVHWLVYNIPTSTDSTSEGHAPAGGLVGKNDNGTDDYFGPKPPSGVHHYHFKVFAIDEKVTLPSGASKNDVMKAIQGHTLGKGEIVGTYEH